MSTEIVTRFLDDMTKTATSRDLDALLDLISRSLQVFGVSGFDVINDDDRATQCAHEFNPGLIKSVTYQG